MNVTYLIRELTVSDAAAMAPVHIRSWQAAYKGLISQSHLDGLDVDQRTSMWISLLSDPNEGARLIAEVDGEVVGFLVGSRISKTTAGAGEIYSIYLDPDHWRAGLGARLLAEGVAQLRVISAIPLVLWVVDGNERALRFYEARGWRSDGATRGDVIGDQLVPHVRYRLD